MLTPLRTKFRSTLAASPFVASETTTETSFAHAPSSRPQNFTRSTGVPSDPVWITELNPAPVAVPDASNWTDDVAPVVSDVTRTRPDTTEFVAPVSAKTAESSAAVIASMNAASPVPAVELPASALAVPPVRVTIVDVPFRVDVTRSFPEAFDAKRRALYVRNQALRIPTSSSVSAAPILTNSLVLNAFDGTTSPLPVRLSVSPFESANGPALVVSK